MCLLFWRLTGWWQKGSLMLTELGIIRKELGIRCRELGIIYNHKTWLNAVELFVERFGSPEVVQSNVLSKSKLNKSYY